MASTRSSRAKVASSFSLTSRGSLETEFNIVEQFHLLMEGISDYAIFLLNPDGFVTSWSTAAEKLFGYRADEIEGRHFSSLYLKEDAENLETRQELRMASAHGRFEDTHWQVRKDGSQFWAESVICPLRKENGELRGFSQIIRDITERKKAQDALRQKEEELAQARKLEAIGRLAGGVAHDFNNYLTGIMGLSREIYESLDSSDSRRADLDEILKTADRARVLTRELLAFGRRQISSPVVLDLNAAIHDKKKSFARLLGAEIVLEISLEPSIGHIRIDPTQLDQVLLNLLVNARDAMPQGGRIIMATERLDIKEATQDLPAGSYVKLSIADTGCGMDENVRTHLFEPFFTTKKHGKGTGLGLATVYGIVKQNEGTISVESRLGHGAVFQILFPEINAPVEKKSAPRAVVQSAGSETILVVEDEDIVRRVTQRILEQNGYHVLVASSGESALDIAQQYSSPIHLLLTDVVMPEMNGRFLAERLSVRHPESLVLYMSAYSEDVIHQRGILAKGLAFIEKPFTRETLTHKISDLLKTGTEKAR